MAMVGVVSVSLYRRTHSLSGLAWSWVGGRLAPSNKPGELSQWLWHDDSTVNIVLVIIIIIGHSVFGNGDGMRILTWIFKLTNAKFSHKSQQFQSRLAKFTLSLRYFGCRYIFVVQIFSWKCLRRITIYSRLITLCSFSRLYWIPTTLITPSERVLVRQGQS